MAGPVAIPESCFELEELRGTGSWRSAGWVIDAFFGPANDLAKIVVPCADGIVTTEAGKLDHLALLPCESDTGIAADETERGTGEGFAERIGDAVFGYAGDEAEVIFDGPSDVAAGSAERTERGLHTVRP